MLCGNPSGFAFLIERIPEWEVSSWKNGLMFVIVNDDIYPKDVRTTTFNSELPDLLNPDSAFMHPVIDKALFAKNDQEILDYVTMRRMNCMPDILFRFMRSKMRAIACMSFQTAA